MRLAGSTAAAVAAAAADRVVKDNPVMVRCCDARCAHGFLTACLLSGGWLGACGAQRVQLSQEAAGPQQQGQAALLPAVRWLLLGASRCVLAHPLSAEAAHARLSFQLQSDALRRNVKKLVTHFGGVQPYAYAGVLVGLRQYTPPQEGRGAQRGTTLDRWLTEVQAGRR